jgi:hypothetical protein
MVTLTSNLLLAGTSLGPASWIEPIGVQHYDGNDRWDLHDPGPACAYQGGLIPA